MDKWRLRVALKILDEVRICFPDTKQFIEDSIEQSVSRKIYQRKRLFFCKFRSKELAQKNIFYFVLNMLRDILLS